MLTVPTRSVVSRVLAVCEPQPVVAADVVVAVAAVSADFVAAVAVVVAVDAVLVVAYLVCYCCYQVVRQLGIGV